MVRSDRRIRICAVLLALVLAFIWGNSLMPASASRAFSNWVGQLLGLLPEGVTEDTPGGGLLRKAAHFTEFTALGMLLFWLFEMLQKKPYIPFLLGAAAACVDETIQIFVPERGPSVWDVCLDSCGVLAGMVLLYFGHTYYGKRN